MWIDTHTHFDFSVFDDTRSSDWKKAQKLGVSAQFVMAVSPHNFEQVSAVAEQYTGTYFALGIHPLFIQSLDLSVAIEQLKTAIIQQRDNPTFIGIGEIGLDGFVKDSNFDKQVAFFTAQLKLAREFEFPVFMHVRKSQDVVLKYCRQFGVGQGIAHAFNGSLQQADNYLAQGFKLGFGSAFTFERAKQLRRLVTELPLEAFVLETDCPDMSPAWAYQQTNYSYHLPRIAAQFADLRQIEVATLAHQVRENTEVVISRTLP